MAFRPEAEFPDFSRILESLNQAQISVKNPALYQAIKQLIDKVLQFKDLNQTQIENILADITDLSNTVNNINTGNTINLPSPNMPVFDGVDGDDGFPIPGRNGKDGLDGKTIPNFGDYPSEPDTLIPFGPFGCCPDAASEITSTTTGNIDDFDFNNARLIRFNNATDTTLRGLKAGVAGQLVTIVSVGAGHVFLEHENAGSSAANRLFNTITSGPTPLATTCGKATYRYDGTSARWRLIAHDQGQFIDIPYASTTYDSDTGAFWTVDAGDVIVQKILIVGRQALVICTYVTTTVLVGVGSRLRADFSGYKTWTWLTTTRNYARIDQSPAANAIGMITCAAGTSRIQFSRDVTDPVWAASVNLTLIDGATVLLGVN